MSTLNQAQVSVVIPVKNEAGKIRDCINGILSQTIAVKEIIVIDSGSTDGTLGILKEFPAVKIIEIPSAEFNHGTTRNIGVQHSTAEFVLLTVGDAKAYDNMFIEHMLKTILADDNIAGVCGSQVVPHDNDKNPAEWFRPVSQPKVTTYKFSKEAYEALPPIEKRRVCGWDDVIALYRKSVLTEIPFRHTTYAEDALWAQDAIRAGYTLAYNPAARVYHYHLEDPDFSFKRNYTVQYHCYKFFGLIYDKPAFTTKGYLRLAKVLLKAEGISLSEKLKWWNYNITTMKGSVKANEAVRRAIAKGEDFFDKEHLELCGKPPVPKKTT